METEKKRFHSVRLEKNKCRGCTNCLKRCPTEAIRVRGGRAHIIDERCIDCGECIRVCDYHAKVAVTDPLSSISRFKYKIALPAPSLYGQFKNLRHIAQVLTGLRQMGFDDVFEVARGADVVTRAIREKLRQPDLPRPLISAACPVIVRLIQVRFPDLIEHIVDVRQPMEVAALIARQEFARKHQVDPADVGCFFITPCPAKVTAIRNPIGHEQSAVDGAISVLEIYGLLSSHTRSRIMDNALELATSYGVGWANSGGEANAVCPDNALAVDGIENVIRVLEEIEDERIGELDFIELNACAGGCVGGVLCVENPYVAKARIQRLRKYLPVSQNHLRGGPVPEVMEWNTNLEFSDVLTLSSDLKEAMQMMARIDEIEKEFPGLDCGACGAPTCRAFAEDVVKGMSRKAECIFVYRKQMQQVANTLSELECGVPLLPKDKD